jgi:hypothetical protein
MNFPFDTNFFHTRAFVHPLRRPRLAARWRRAGDGRLECRWYHLPSNDPPF